MDPREEQTRSASSTVQVVELLVSNTGQDWGRDSFSLDSSIELGEATLT